MPIKTTKPKRLRKMLFDYETNDKWAPYAVINLIGFQIDDGPVKVIKFDKDNTYLPEFLDALADPEVEKIGFNIVNYDNQVSFSYHFKMAGKITDVYLQAKSLWPDSAAYTLKFLAFMKLGDIHWEEGQVEAYKRCYGITNWMAIPDRILIPYLHKDIKQLRDLWEYCKNELLNTIDISAYRPREFQAYEQVEARGGYHMNRMIFNGIYVDKKFCTRRLDELEEEKAELDHKAKRLHGVANLLSNDQVTEVLDLDDWTLALTDNGHFSLNKMELQDLIIDRDPKGNVNFKSPYLQNMVYAAREIKAQRGFLENFLEASDYPLRTVGHLACIPTAFSQSLARSLRFISGSKFGINFQNINEVAKQGIAVPLGWIEGQVDLTAIEEVIHIYYTRDETRRALYESDESYSSYVELCNAFYGKKKSKAEWDIPKFPANPAWSIYKAFKTAKLAANFGMGSRKFSKTHRCTLEAANEILGALHTAQPAIKDQIQEVTNLLKRHGTIYDPFGHAYRGPIDKAYKCVAYRIQGTAASLLKMMLWDVGELFEREDLECCQLVATVHDSIIFRLHSSLGLERILRILKVIRKITTEKYSPLFDGIPLRSKPSLSITNWRDLKSGEFHWNKLEATTTNLLN